MNPPDYYYETPTVPSLNWAIDPYSTDYQCTITYTCAVIAGPVATDICNLVDATINSVFDGTVATYTVTTADMVSYPPGQYTFEITGHVGSNNSAETFIATFVDPCPTTPLTIITPDPFVDATYRLRSPAQNQPWDIANLIT